MTHIYIKPSSNQCSTTSREASAAQRLRANGITAEVGIVHGASRYNAFLVRALACRSVRFSHYCADHARDFARGGVETYLIEKPWLSQLTWGPKARTNANGAFSRAVCFLRLQMRADFSALAQKTLRIARAGTGSNANRSQKESARTYSGVESNVSFSYALRTRKEFAPKKNEILPASG